MYKLQLGCKDGNGSGSGWIDQKSDLRKNSRVKFNTRTRAHRWNLALEPEPIGIQVGFMFPSGFVNVLRSGFFQISIGVFWVSVFSCSFRVVLDFIFLERFRVHPRVKNETHIRTRLCTGQVRVQPMGSKMNPHPLGLKPAGDPNPNPNCYPYFDAMSCH
jgi:hypothetical protein